MEPKLVAARPARSEGADARAAVADLYRAHAVGLIRPAVVMPGDRPERLAAAGPASPAAVSAEHATAVGVTAFR